MQGGEWGTGTGREIPCPSRGTGREAIRPGRGTVCLIRACCGILSGDQAACVGVATCSAPDAVCIPKCMCRSSDRLRGTSQVRTTSRPKGPADPSTPCHGPLLPSLRPLCRSWKRHPPHGPQGTHPKGLHLVKADGPAAPCRLGSLSPVEAQALPHHSQ